MGFMILAHAKGTASFYGSQDADETLRYPILGRDRVGKLLLGLTLFLSDSRFKIDIRPTGFLGNAFHRCNVQRTGALDPEEIPGYGQRTVRNPDNVGRESGRCGDGSQERKMSLKLSSRRYLPSTTPR